MLSLFLTHLEGYKKDAVKAPILIILEVICELLLPLVMAEIVDTAIPSQDTGYIFALGGLMLLLACSTRYRTSPSPISTVSPRRHSSPA